MSYFSKFFTAAALALPLSVVHAAPTYLITHNNTDVESNAYIDGTRPSPCPSKAHDTNTVAWIIVQMACLSKASTGKCTAVIKMETNTKTPVTVGTVELTLADGTIQPQSLVANGYRMTVNGPAEITLDKITR